MNQERIGQFIALRRKEKKLTQSDLAEKLGITNRSVSKWETGKCLPDISLFNPLCNILDININELLAGEKLSKERIENNKEVINYMEYSKKKEKFKFLIISFVFLIIVIITFLGAYFLTNFNKTTTYELSGKSENFSYSGGLLIVSNYKNILSSGKVIAEKTELENVEILSVTLKSDTRTIVSGNMFLDGAGLVQEDYGYNEILDKEKIDNIDNWYLEILYVIDNNLEIEKIEIQNEIITKNNRFLNFKTEQIDQEKKRPSNGEDFDYEISLMKFLEEKGYSHNKESYFYLEKVLNDERNLHEVVTINPVMHRILYTYTTDKNNYYNIQYTIYTPSYEYSSLNVNGKFNGKEYSYLYNASEDSINCTNGECPGSAWQDVKRFLNDFDDIINFEQR